MGGVVHGRLLGCDHRPGVRGGGVLAVCYCCHRLWWSWLCVITVTGCGGPGCTHSGVLAVYHSGALARAPTVVPWPVHHSCVLARVPQVVSWWWCLAVCYYCPGWWCLAVCYYCPGVVFGTVW